MYLSEVIYVLTRICFQLTLRFVEAEQAQIEDLVCMTCVMVKMIS